MSKVPCLGCKASIPANTSRCPVCGKATGRAGSPPTRQIRSDFVLGIVLSIIMLSIFFWWRMAGNRQLERIENQEAEILDGYRRR